MKPITKRHFVQFNERLEEMLAELVDKNGYVSDSECIRQAIIALHAKNFPNYVREKQANQSPEERERKRIERLDGERLARLSIVKDNGTTLCEQLGGTVVETGKDMFACVYNEYAYLNKHQVDVKEQKIPLENLTKDNVENQYRYATKEVIDAIINPASSTISEDAE